MEMASGVRAEKQPEWSEEKNDYNDGKGQLDEVVESGGHFFERKY